MCLAIEIRHRACAHIYCYVPTSTCLAGFSFLPTPGRCIDSRLTVSMIGNSPISHCDECIRTMSDEIAEYYNPLLQRTIELNGPSTTRHYRTLEKWYLKEMEELYEEIGGVDRWRDAHRERYEAEVAREEEEEGHMARMQLIAGAIVARSTAGLANATDQDEEEEETVIAEEEESDEEEAANTLAMFRAITRSIENAIHARMAFVAADAAEAAGQAPPVLDREDERYRARFNLEFENMVRAVFGNNHTRHEASTAADADGNQESAGDVEVDMIDFEEGEELDDMEIAE